MRESLIFKFTITYFICTTIIWSLIKLLNIQLNFNGIMEISFILTFYHILLSIDNKIKQNEELTKNNYWQLKNQIKKSKNKKIL